MRFPRRALAAAFIALVFGFANSAPAAADQQVLCRSYRWSCDGKLGYNPNKSYWRQLTGHNCTNYVAFRMIRRGVSANFGPIGGNAVKWDEYFKAKGFKVDKHPAVGAIAQWNAYEHGLYGASGHVAYVSKVGKGFIVVDEDGWGSINMRRIIYKGDRHWPGRFIHVTKAKPKKS